MTIKLLRAKRDLFMEDGDCHLFATKGRWYEIVSTCDVEVLFTDDKGEEHFYPYDEIDEDFWTIDFEKGFELLNSSNERVAVKNHRFTLLHRKNEGRVDESLFIRHIISGLYKVVHCSNQKETQVKKVKPSKEERPYENWKMSINKDKFIRCIEPEEMIYETVEGLVGWLNKDTNMFYYKVKSKQHLSAKVYPFSYPDSTIGYEFVKENKDAKGYRPKSKPVTEDKYEFCPENIWDINWKNAPWEINSSCEDENASILDVVESTRKSILASFGVPEDLLGQEDVYSTELKFNHPEYNIVEGSESLEEEFKTEWSDKHYDFNYSHTLTEEDIEKGEIVIKIDPYFVNRMWKINTWDDTGAAFHCLKNYARMSNGKNPLERDLTSLYKQVKRLCELHGVVLK